MAKLRSFTRWGAWENDILATLDNPERCQKVILQRQKEVDSDERESEMVADYFREQLRRKHGQNPETCHVFIRQDRIAQWVEDATSLGLAKTKVTPYLTALGIPELTQRRTKNERGWCWRGLHAKPNQALRHLQHTPQSD